MVADGWVSSPCFSFVFLILSWLGVVGFGKKDSNVEKNPQDSQAGVSMM
jgi:hypothetical protein